MQKKKIAARSFRSTGKNALNKTGRISMVRKIPIFLVIAAVFFSSLRTQHASQKFVKIYFPEGGSLTAELAVTQEERARGLMYREKLEFDQGMLFVFEEEDFHSFWMKNMAIPLDLLWIDKDKRIVHIEQDVPPCREDPCPTYTSRIPAMFVLEMKAGSVKRRGLKILDRLDFML